MIGDESEPEKVELSDEPPAGGQTPPLGAIREKMPPNRDRYASMRMSMPELEGARGTRLGLEDSAKARMRRPSRLANASASKM